MSMLRGENQIEHFRQITEELTSRITAYKGVAGVVFIGGLARGFADKFSDVDIVAFLSNRDERLRRRIRDVGLGIQRQYGVDVDLEVHFLEDFKRWRWNEVDMWEFSRAEFVVSL
jgi:predicted nucleotidyltransferase